MMLLRIFRRLFFSLIFILIGLISLVFFIRMKGLTDYFDSTNTYTETKGKRFASPTQPVIQRASVFTNNREIGNFKSTANISTSRLDLKKKNNIYNIGETIKVNIILNNGWGKPILTGGDVLSIWMKQPSTRNSVSGYVVDNGNGSHTGFITPLWNGTSELIVSIANTKEHIDIFTNYLKDHGIFYTIEAIFIEHKVNTSKPEHTPCNVEFGLFGNASVCNFTKDNFGMSWYCRSPQRYNCSDWMYFTINKNINPLSNKSLHLFRTSVHQRTKIDVTIKDNGKFKLPILQNCMAISKNLTWKKPAPTGYYQKGKWKNLICNTELPRTPKDYFKCLEGRRLLILGDSTNRLWFANLMGFLGLTFTSGRWDEIKDKAWQKYAHAELKSRRISIDWAPHELPFYGTQGSLRYNIRSEGFRLDEIPANSSDIVVLHWYLHIARVSHDIFREHVRNARQAVLRLVKRAPNVDIFIKGPHSLTYVDNLLPYNFIRQKEQQILFEEFSDLLNRVIYLDQWDATVANENVHVHPTVSNTVDMIHTMLSYICGK
ncbi:NXPE family member 2-like isoform X2 [Mizuhopecten yessoensis]|nr:NXPE family member 2-like isoform X2 [Mizuhopecten yessoensis]XP_021376492.1 NXPE family member 2-like isoform X2 [Mizuhopecten yessoensis]